MKQIEPLKSWGVRGALAALLALTAVGAEAPQAAAAAGAPSCTAVEQADGTFQVSWTLGTSIDKYVIDRSVNGSSYNWRGAKFSPSTSFNDAESWGATTTYRIRSKDAANAQVGNPTPCTGGGGATTTVFAIGDIAECADLNNPNSGSRLVSRLLDARGDGKIILLGDLAYDWGRDPDFECFANIVGNQNKQDLIPAVGNHEYGQNGVITGYWNYFQNVGVFANGYGPKRTVSDFDSTSRLYYETWVDGWQVLVLDSECWRLQEGKRNQPNADSPNGCDEGSLQYQWLESKLAAEPNVCRIAAMHIPRWSSAGANRGSYSDQVALSEIYTLLDRYGTDMVLAGHAHRYERFVPQDAFQNPDQANGFQLLIAGTGGTPLREAEYQAPNSAVVIDDSFGVLELGLGANSYTWKFVSAATNGQGDLTQAILDSGSRGCINKN